MPQFTPGSDADAFALEEYVRAYEHEIPDFRILEDVLAAPTTVIRGGLCLLSHVQRNHEATGFETGSALSAISARARTGWGRDQLAANPPLRNATVRQTSVGTLRNFGFGVLATQWEGHCTILIQSCESADELRDALAFLISLFAVPLPNPAR